MKYDRLHLFFYPFVWALCLLSTTTTVRAEPLLQGMEEVARLAVTAEVAPYTTVKLSTHEITFDVRGEPGNYFAAESVEVTVGSNQSKWSVFIQASDLVPVAGEARAMPASRLAFAVQNGETFTNLAEKKVLLHGDAAREPEPMVLQFRLTTSWQDLPGTYKGQVIFAFLNNP